MEGGGGGRRYLKVWVSLPVVSFVVYSHVDGLSCCCLPHFYCDTLENKKSSFRKHKVQIEALRMTSGFLKLKEVVENS